MSDWHEQMGTEDEMTEWRSRQELMDEQEQRILAELDRGEARRKAEGKPPVICGACGAEGHIYCNRKDPKWPATK